MVPIASGAGAGLSLVAVSDAGALLAPGVAVAGESLRVEFKSDRERLPDAEVYRNVVCLANANGGAILLGVENDGSVSGLHASRYERVIDPIHVQAAIFNNTMPPINTRVSLRPWADKHVVLIAHRGVERQGFIAGFFAPHPFNPLIKVLSETFWWVGEAFREYLRGLSLRT